MKRDLDISLVRAFLAVIDADGVTAAASVLGVSQAAASQQIKRLEEVLECVFLPKLPVIHQSVSRSVT